jgi:hypothetical protein
MVMVRWWAALLGLRAYRTSTVVWMEACRRHGRMRCIWRLVRNRRVIAVPLTFITPRIPSQHLQPGAVTAFLVAGGTKWSFFLSWSHVALQTRIHCSQKRNGFRKNCCWEVVEVVIVPAGWSFEMDIVGKW